LKVFRKHDALIDVMRSKLLLRHNEDTQYFYLKFSCSIKATINITQLVTTVAMVKSVHIHPSASNYQQRNMAGGSEQQGLQWLCWLRNKDAGQGWS
jgi:hypothetical protein